MSGRVGIKRAVDAAAFAEHGDLEPIDDTIELRRFFVYTSGEFGRLVPPRVVRWRHGVWGAWEIAARLSYLDPSGAEGVGGRMLIGTAGLNWNWNRHLRLLFNTNLAQLRDGVEDGTVAIFQMRTQLVF